MRRTILFPGKSWPLTLLLLASLFACHTSEDESAQDKTRNLLTSGPWHVTRVTADDMDKTSTFAGLTLTFTATTYTTLHGAPVWSPSGTWTFTDENAKSFTRDDGVLVTIRSLTATHLSLSLTAPYPILEEGGRTVSLTGEYVFEFDR